MAESPTAAARGPVTDQLAGDWVGQFLAAWNSRDPARLIALSTDDVGATGEGDGVALPSSPRTPSL